LKEEMAKAAARHEQEIGEAKRKYELTKRELAE